MKHQHNDAEQIWNSKLIWLSCWSLCSTSVGEPETEVNVHCGVVEGCASELNNRWQHISLSPEKYFSSANTDILSSEREVYTKASSNKYITHVYKTMSKGMTRKLSSSWCSHVASHHLMRPPGVECGRNIRRKNINPWFYSYVEVFCDGFNGWEEIIRDMKLLLISLTDLLSASLSKCIQLLVELLSQTPFKTEKFGENNFFKFRS